ncbi:ROK family transcriptional regulator [Kiloniella sp. EL199]|uniref:ROK family transcriptional regulator n=1 Tax=Kiloniella sp. EL199 TaxID=2107581 RepID=UPI000EA2ADED|nr:ROK family transcriptional regulator [Kiloniella sp. EL199]
MPPKGTNLEQTKAHNLRLVLSEILSGDEISRADIAKRTGLTRQTISNLVEKLLEANFVTEGNYKKGGAGKPSRILQISSTAAFSIGIRIEINKIAISLVDLSGNLMHSEQVDATYSTDEDVIRLIEPLCLDVLRDTKTDIRRVLGIGIIMAENDDRNHRHATSDLITDPKNIAELLYKELKIPTFLETAAAAAALAEFLQGSARNFRNFIYLFIGPDLSAGLMVDGKIYGGRSARAGSIGHLVVNINGPICTCGNPGCLNGYISLESLTTYLQKQDKIQRDPYDSFADIPPNDPRVISWLEQQAEYFRVGINSLENLYDPETIILGGDCPDWFLEAVIRLSRPFMRSISERGERDLPRVIKSPHADQMVQKGAATLPIHAALGEENAAYKSQAQFGVSYQRLSELLGHYINEK